MGSDDHISAAQARELAALLIRQPTTLTGGTNRWTPDNALHISARHPAWGGGADYRLLTRFRASLIFPARPKNT